MSHPSRWLTLGLCLAALGACQSPTRVDGDPAMLSILMLSLDDNQTDGWESSERDLLDGFVDAVVARLGELDAAVEIRRATLRTDVPLTESVDLIIQPSIAKPPRAESSIVGLKGTLSGLLWFGTWAGGMVLDDHVYSFGPEFVVEFALSPGGRKNLPFATLEVEPDPIPMAFYERTGLWNWQLLFALVVPPFLLPDNEAETALRLKEGLADAVAIKLTRFLKNPEDFEQLALVQGPGSMHIESAAYADGVLRIKGSATSGSPIVSVVATIGDQVHELENKNKRAADSESTPSEFRFDEPIILEGASSIPPGTVKLRAQAATMFSRTVPVR